MDEYIPTPSTAAQSTTFFHVHLISDSTGETLSTVLKAVAACFNQSKPLVHVASLVRSPKQLQAALNRIEESPGLVMYTLIDEKMRWLLEVQCAELHVTAIPVLDPILNAFTNYLGLQKTMRQGAQHALDEDYFQRMAALDYTLSHDDGQMMWDLETADVVLVGISRTSKTPTCMYLANRGVKAANVPLIPSGNVPAELLGLKHPLIVGLVASSDRLAQIRSTRLKNLEADMVMNYSDADTIRSELVHSKRLFAKMGWPIIDVTRRSVEETAAAILTRLSARVSDAATIADKNI